MPRASRQLHVWLTESDYAFLKSQAERTETTLVSVLRGILREHRLQFAQRSMTAETQDRSLRVAQASGGATQGWLSAPRGSVQIDVPSWYQPLDWRIRA